MLLLQYLCGVWTSWTLDLHKSMKIRENPKNVRPGLNFFFFASKYHVLIFFSLPELRATDKYKNSRLEMNLDKIFDFQFHGQTLTIL